MSVGLKVDPSKVISNPGLRHIAKALANQFWGFQARRTNLPTTCWIHNYGDFLRLVNSTRFTVTSVKLFENHMLVNYEELTEHPSSTGSLAVGNATTAWSRLTLLQSVSDVNGGLRASGEQALYPKGRPKVLYMDTDSILVRHPVSSSLPLLISDSEILKWKDETPRMSTLRSPYIAAFTASGPKSYTVTFRSKEDTVAEEVIFKMKGIRLCSGAMKSLTGAAFSGIVRDRGSLLQIPDQFQITRRFDDPPLRNRHLTKSIRFTVDSKRMIPDPSHPTLSTLPFGFHEKYFRSVT